mmetsp:Transcript_88784/g.287493  ORF Transcript_88784/g.287493 Transcript_88784/m.287493 type:complete len:215 (-) Transcript_88784:601-1245(-)
MPIRILWKAFASSKMVRSPLASMSMNSNAPCRSSRNSTVGLSAVARPRRALNLIQSRDPVWSKSTALMRFCTASCAAGEPMKRNASTSSRVSTTPWAQPSHAAKSRQISRFSNGSIPSNFRAPARSIWIACCLGHGPSPRSVQGSLAFVERASKPMSWTSRLKSRTRLRLLSLVTLRMSSVSFSYMMELRRVSLRTITGTMTKSMNGHSAQAAK